MTLGLSSLGFFIVDPAKRADTKIAGPPTKVYLTLRRRQPHNPATFLHAEVTHFNLFDEGNYGGGPYLLGASEVEVFLLYNFIQQGVYK